MTSGENTTANCTGRVAFGDFLLDFDRRVVERGDETILLKHEYWAALVRLIEARPDPVEFSELQRVLGVSSPNSAHQAFGRIRRAIGDTSRPPRFIVSEPKTGYRFIGVPETPASSPDTNSIIQTDSSRRHTWFVCTATFLYSGLFVFSCLIEVASQFDKYGGIMAAVAFGLILPLVALTTLAAVHLGKRLMLLTAPAAFALMFGVLLLGSIAGTFVAERWLPHYPITESTIQSQPAHLAFAKNIFFYYLPLASVFLLVPYRFVAILQKRLEDGDFAYIRTALAGRSIVGPMEAAFITPTFLGVLLLSLLPVSFSLTYRLFDHLRPGPYHSLFIGLVLGRNVFYFGFGALCLWWYRTSLAKFSAACAVVKTD